MKNTPPTFDPKLHRIALRAVVFSCGLVAVHGLIVVCILAGLTATAGYAVQVEEQHDSQSEREDDRENEGENSPQDIIQIAEISFKGMGLALDDNAVALPSLRSERCGEIQISGDLGQARSAFLLTALDRQHAGRAP